MFGHQDENQNNNDRSASHSNNLHTRASGSQDDSAQQTVAPSDDIQLDALANFQPSMDGSAPQPASHPQDPQDPAPGALSPAGGYPMAAAKKVQSNSFSDDDMLGPAASATDDLASIKIQALDELYPLIDKLNLSPDERFRTLMMMIQASDNQDLVQSAYDAAHQIKDEKAKAQALLDIVNEINYFTQQPVN